MAGQIKWVVLTEDINTKMIEKLFINSGYPIDNTLFFSYKTSSNIESAKVLAAFILEISPSTKVIIHRDSDFVNTDEVLTIFKKIEEVGAIPFITEGSDIESYYLNPGHLALHLDVSITDIENWLYEIAQSEHMLLQHHYTRKRDEVKNLLYRKKPQNCPDTMSLLGSVIPLPVEKRLGKEMLAKVRGKMHSKFGKSVDVMVPTENLKSEYLIDVLES